MVATLAKSASNSSMMTSGMVNSEESATSSSDLLKKSHAENEKLAATATAHQEREAFVRRLIEFHRHRNVNTPIVSWPSLNGKPIDLHKLYTKVASLGGWERVCEKEKWDEVGMDLEPKTFETCTNGSHALKMFYVRYLGLYEKVHAAVPSSATLSVASLLDSIPASSLSMLSSATPGLNGGVGLGASPLVGAGSALSLGLGFKSVGSGSNLSFLEDKDEETGLLQGRRRFSYLLDAMPSTYNHHQHRPSSSIFQTLTPTPVALPAFTSSPYEKLEISLSSGLANEIDFAFNTILLLSSDEAHAFRLYNSPRLLDLMLAHVGFFGDGDKYEYRRLYDKAWHSKSSDQPESDRQSVQQRIKDLARLVDTESAYYEEYVRNLKRPPRRNFIKFWHEAVKPPDDLYDVERSTGDEEEDVDDGMSDDNDTSRTAQVRRQSKCFVSEKRAILDLLPKMHNKYLETLPEEDLLNLKLPNEVVSNAAEIRRIEQVMVTLSNLSFEDNNAEFMANKSANLFEFLIMCLYCSNSCNEIRKHALDILANVSRKMKLKLLSDKHKRLLLITIRYLIYGNSYNSAEQAEEKASDQDSTTTTSGGAPHDRLNILRGLEILTKLCSQHVDSYTNNESSNEKILAKYKLTTLFGSAPETVKSDDDDDDENSGDEEASNGLKTVTIKGNAPLYLEKVLARIENLLSIQDILILINSLECLYQITQHNEAICNMIINTSPQSRNDATPSPPPPICKFVVLLVNFLTVDMSHFASAGQKLSHQGPMKMYKVVCSSSGASSAAFSYSTSAPVATASNVHIIPSQQQQQQSCVKANSSHPTLLQQTLNNQQLAANKALYTSTTAVKTAPTAAAAAVSSLQDQQQAKNILCNWLRLCFQADPNSALSKAELYPYYQQISKMNSWPAVPVIGFYDTLAATFPQLRYDNENNKINGLKLALNVKQQMALRHQIVANTCPPAPPAPPPQHQQTVVATPSQIAEQTQVTVAPTQQPASKEVQVAAKTPPPTDSGQEPAKANETSVVSQSTKTSKPDIEMPPSVENDENHANSELSEVNSVKIPRIEKCLNHINGKEKANVAEQLIKEIDQNLSQTTTMTGVKKDMLTANRLCNGHYNHSNHSETENENENEMCKNKEEIVKVNGTAHTPGQQVPLTNGYSNSHSENPSSSSSSSLSEDIDMDPIDKLDSDKPDEKANDQDHLTHKRKSDEAEIGKDETESSPSKQVVPEDSVDQDESNKKQKVSAEPANQDPKSTGQQQAKKEPESAAKENGELSPTNTPTHPVVTNGGPVDIPTAAVKASDSLVNGDGGDYLCEWSNCKRGFSTAKAVYNHVCKFHLLGPNGCMAQETCEASDSTSENSGMLCMWLGCDQVRRQKWSLVNHIQERHCSENALKNALLCRQRGMIPILSHPQIPNNSLNYSKDAALYAIQRHQRLRPEDFQLTPEEGPITKSLRLLAALTLRNLATNSKKARSILKSYEPILTSIAFDLFESSTAVASCLWQISHQDETCSQGTAGNS